MRFLTAIPFLLLLLACEKQECIQQTPQPNCICTMEYAPVCGCDGQTYGNACAAECNGIMNYTPGEC